MRLREAILADLPRLHRETEHLGRINIQDSTKGGAAGGSSCVAAPQPQLAGPGRKLCHIPATDRAPRPRAVYACERYEQTAPVNGGRISKPFDRALFLSGVLTGSKVTQQRHLRQARIMQAAIQQRWQRNNPRSWQLKHVCRFLTQHLKDHSDATRYDYRLTVLLIWKRSGSDRQILFGRSVGMSLHEVS